MTTIAKDTYHSVEQAQAAFSNLWDVKFTQREAGELEIRFQTTAIGLFYAFDELLGISPIAYLKAARLQEACRRILASDQQHCVQLVASNLNFAHLGQSSIDHAKHFGESPSQTCDRFHASE